MLGSSGEQQGCSLWRERGGVWGRGTVSLDDGWCGLGHWATLFLALLSSAVHQTSQVGREGQRGTERPCPPSRRTCLPGGQMRCPGKGLQVQRAAGPAQTGVRCPCHQAVIPPSRGLIGQLPSPQDSVNEWWLGFVLLFFPITPPLPWPVCAQKSTPPTSSLISWFGFSCSVFCNYQPGGRMPPTCPAVWQTDGTGSGEFISACAPIHLG